VDFPEPDKPVIQITLPLVLGNVYSVILFVPEIGSYLDVPPLGVMSTIIYCAKDITADITPMLELGAYS
jgi:hypothetical protein